MTTKAWWQSRTVWAVVLGALPKLVLLAGQLGLISRAQQLAEVALLLGSVAMDLAAVAFRWQATGPLGSGQKED